VEVEALLVFPAMSCTPPAGIVAVTISQGAIPETVNSKLVPLFGKT